MDKKFLAIVTGTPGTGKTTVAEIIAKKLDAQLLRLSDLLPKLKAGRSRKFDTALVDENELGTLARKWAKGKERAVIEGHLAASFKMKATHLIILRCEPKELAARLKKRKYNAAKTGENLMAEALDSCSVEARGNYATAKTLEIETAGKKPEQAARRCAEFISNKKIPSDNIDYSSWLKARLGLDIHVR
jgi:adenylate kinase